jgi:HPt (histidine-containing phosphotransfer) domain-containing protein
MGFDRNRLVIWSDGQHVAPILISSACVSQRAAVGKSENIAFPEHELKADSMHEHRPQTIAIEGLDIDALLARIDGDREFMCGILRRFAESQRHAADDLADLIGSDIEAARRRAHDMQGVFGNIGATALFLRAKDLSRMLKSGDIEGATRCASTLRDAIPRLCRRIEDALPASIPTPASPDRAGPVNVDARLDVLAGHLRSGRAREAQRIVAELKGLALSAAQYGLLGQIMPLVSAYRLRDALALLQAARHG